MFKNTFTFLTSYLAGYAAVSGLSIASHDSNPTDIFCFQGMHNYCLDNAIDRFTMMSAGNMLTVSLMDNTKLESLTRLLEEYVGPQSVESLKDKALVHMALAGIYSRTLYQHSQAHQHVEKAKAIDLELAIDFQQLVKNDDSAVSLLLNKAANKQIIRDQYTKKALKQYKLLGKPITKLKLAAKLFSKGKHTHAAASLKINDIIEVYPKYESIAKKILAGQLTADQIDDAIAKLNDQNNHHPATASM